MKFPVLCSKRHLMTGKFKRLLYRLSGSFESLRHFGGISVLVAFAFFIGAIPVRAECWLWLPTATIFDGAYPEAIFGYVFGSSGISITIVDYSTRISSFGGKNINAIVFCEADSIIGGGIGKVLFRTKQCASPAGEPLKFGVGVGWCQD